MNHTGYHSHVKITDLLNYGDFKLKSIVTIPGSTITDTRDELRRLQAAGHSYLVLGQCQYKKPDGSCAGHVLPTPPQRDGQGYYIHPGIPDFHDDGNAIANWIFEQQLTITVQYLYDEPETSDAFQDYFHNDNNAEKWQPTPPVGNGWFMLTLFDSEDGPICWWARHIIEHNILSIPGSKAVA